MSKILALVFLILCRTIFAQDADDKLCEGKTVSEVVSEGFSRYSLQSFSLDTRVGKNLRLDLLDNDIKSLWRKGLFEDIGRRLEKLPGDKVRVVIWVKEYQLIANVKIVGARDIASPKIYEVLRLKAFEVLNPYLLRLDKEDIIAMYVEKGYHFCTVKDEIEKRGPDVVLKYVIFEGPLVLVDEIKFTGSHTVSPGDLKSFMLTRESGIFSRNPYVEKHLREDLERIKLYLRLEGYLDIYHGNRVFVEDVRFNDSKTYATITLHVDTGRQYFLRNISFTGQDVYSEAEMRRGFPIRTGDKFSEQELYRAVQKLRDLFGERAYLNCEVDPEWYVVGIDKIDLVFEIKPKDKVTVGKIQVQGNTKTRENRIRLDMRDFVPGEEFDTKKFHRAIQRLRDRGWFEVGPQGITYEFQDSGAPNVKDVLLKVHEGQTARFQFAGGYSSAFGIIGMIEFTQRNFDIGNPPHSFDEIGEAWSGGGQELRLRLAPGARRQTYSVLFREPYLMGEEVGMSISARYVSTIREDWDEVVEGAGLSFDKRWDRLIASVSLRVSNTEIKSVSDGAPQIVKDIQGSNLIVSVGPGLAYDTRDSIIQPTEGYRGEIGYQVAARAIGSDFNFGRLTIEGQYHIPVFELESRARHVLSFKGMVGWAQPFGNTEEVPIFERFFAGGRDSIRGFRFRGIGPLDNGDHIGGRAMWTSTVEYTVPVWEQMVFVAGWFDSGSVSGSLNGLPNEKIRTAAGFGLRFVIPALGNIPVSLDFGFALNKEDGDNTQFVLFDLGPFF